VFAQKRIGIDISDETITMVCVERIWKRIRISAQTVFTLEKDASTRDKMPLIRDIVQDFIKKHKVAMSDISVGIPDNLSIFKEIEFPSAVKDNIRTTLKYELEKHIPVSVDDVLYDYDMMFENRSPGKITVMTAVVKKQAVLPYLDFVSTFSGGIGGMEIRSMALANFFAYADSLGKGRNLQMEKADIFRSAISRPVQPEHMEATGILSEDMAAAFGLAIKGLWKVPFDINLLPLELRKKPSKIGRYMAIMLAVAAILSALTWGGSHIVHERIKLKNLDAELKRLRSDIRDVDRIRSGFPALESRILLLNRLRSGTSPVLEVLRELSQILPDTAWLRDLLLTGRKIQLEGTAESASGLIPILEESPLFEDVHFLSTITRDREGKEKFRIEFTITNLHKD